MGKGLKIFLVVLGILLLIVFASYSFLKGTYNTLVTMDEGYNTLVTMDEGVKGAWAQVENQLQRRYDLIPNYVETVKGC